MTSKFTGVIPALLTPFDSKQQIDEASLRRLVRWNLKQGVDGLYVGGSTAEAFVQSVEERQFVLKVVADEVRDHATKGKTTLIAHVGCISTAECQTLAQSAQGLEYDAVSAVTPFYYPFSFEEHCNHYRAIIEAAPKLPMVVYNFPAMSGVKLSLAQISELIQLPNVIALKQTSDNLYQMEQIRRAHPDKIIYNGYDEIFLSGQMAGANGGIGSTYNVMSWRYSNIIKLIAEGKFEEARQQQTECNKVIDLLIEAGVFRGLKTILHYMGVIDNPICRQPFGPVKEQHLPALRAMANELEAEFKQQK